ncbi:hypothetical protein TNIN_244511 [Trichonephila inaurata madagascariensis]|uniref:Uncharacterized protein n=1 Tax=Trichonephila inaurata madagascariensis TaxID=2747483 RepID=A0A8X7BPL1_9ARAC|nr:hypothetical protein TNIN_244511 [Trichonephila inaurata madagascariensis]
MDSDPSLEEKLEEFPGICSELEILYEIYHLSSPNEWMLVTNGFAFRLKKKVLENVSACVMWGLKAAMN